MPSAGDVAKQLAADAITSKLGGFGRKKQQAQPPPDEDSAAGQQAQTASVLMKSKTELTGFSSAPIDSGKFAVPAGFTQVQPQLLQAK